MIDVRSSDNTALHGDLIISLPINLDTVSGFIGPPPNNVDETHSFKDNPPIATPVLQPHSLLYIAEQLITLNKRVQIHIEEFIRRADLEALALKSSCKRGRKRKRKAKAP
jgi:hypothetical protein